MDKNLYKYNKRTLRFEKAGIPWDRILFRVLGFSGIAFGTFFGLAYLKSRYFGSEESVRLRKENEAIAYHRTRLQAELTEIRGAVQNLSKEEENLYKTVYFTDRNDQGPAAPTVNPDDLDRYEFHDLADRTLIRLGSLFDRASGNNSFFGNFFWPGKEDHLELRHLPVLPPVKGFEVKQVACGFGMQINPFNKKPYKHSGIDVLAEHGTAVLAAGNGVIRSITVDGAPGGAGTSVLIDHGDGYQTKYSRLEHVLVRTGQKVAKGLIIADIGLSGSSIAPHLHFEILRNGKHVDPALVLVENLSEADLVVLQSVGQSPKQALD
ncbi:MAG: M23 family metallopeptidase [Bacteroidetes bacterium]|nr:M23 family metallopeptidase [Bacteroidota bacterium]